MPWKPLQTWAPIDSHEALLGVLKERLEYCTCADPDAIGFLRQFLRLVAERSHAIADNDMDRVRTAHQAMEELLEEAGSPALQSWFVYALEKADLVQHNFNRYDLLIADRGLWLLDGLERHPEALAEEEGNQHGMTEGISLRCVELGDLQIFFEQQLDPDARKMAAFPGREHDAFMAHWRKILDEGTGIVRTILCDAKVAGNIGSWDADGEWRVGYWLGKEFWGRGVASAALAQFLDHVKTRPLFARVAKGNVASIRVLQKCGFTMCGEDHFTMSSGERDEEYIMTLAANSQ